AVGSRRSLQRDSLAHVADDIGNYLWIPDGEECLDQSSAGHCIAADCGSDQQPTNCGHRIAGAVLGPRQSRRIFSRLFGLADFRDVLNYVVSVSLLYSFAQTSGTS